MNCLRSVFLRSSYLNSCQTTVLYKKFLYKRSICYFTNRYIVIKTIIAYHEKAFIFCMNVNQENVEYLKGH